MTYVSNVPIIFLYFIICILCKLNVFYRYLKEIDYSLIKMTDLSDIQRAQIVGAHMAGANVTENAQILDISRGTVSKEMTAFEREGKMSSAKHRSGQKLKLSERDCQTLNGIVREDWKTMALKITADLNECL